MLLHRGSALRVSWGRTAKSKIPAELPWHFGGGCRLLVCWKLRIWYRDHGDIICSVLLAAKRIPHSFGIVSPFRHFQEVSPSRSLSTILSTAFWALGPESGSSYQTVGPQNLGVQVPTSRGHQLLDRLEGRCHVTGTRQDGGDLLRTTCLRIAPAFPASAKRNILVGQLPTRVEVAMLPTNIN